MSKTENDKFELELVPTDLGLSFEGLHESFAEAMRKKRIGFSVHTARLRNRYVWCDRQNLKRIFRGIQADRQGKKIGTFFNPGLVFRDFA